MLYKQNPLGYDVTGELGGYMPGGWLSI